MKIKLLRETWNIPPNTTKTSDMNNYMQNKHKKTKDGEKTDLAMDFRTQGKREFSRFSYFLIRQFSGEVVYQETPEDVGKNEMNTKTQ